MAHLKKRKSSSGKVMWYIQYKLDGTWKRKSCGTTVKRIAQEAMVKFQRLEEEGRLGILNRKPATLAEFVADHLDNEDLKLSIRWAKNKRLILERLIVPFFKPQTRLKDISTARVESYRRSRKRDGISNRTINIEVNALLRMLRHAIELGELEERFLPKVKRLKETKGRLRYLSLSEIEALCSAAHEHSGEMDAYVLLMLFCGLRSGEVLTLRWEDCDLDHKFINVTPRKDWSPKSRMARTVPIPPDLFTFLEHRQTEFPDAVLVVEGKKGLSPYMVKRRFSDVVMAAELPTTGEKAVTAHVLRHTYASSPGYAGNLNIHRFSASRP